MNKYNLKVSSWFIKHRKFLSAFIVLFFIVFAGFVTFFLSFYENKDVLGQQTEDQATNLAAVTAPAVSPKVTPSPKAVLSKTVTNISPSPSPVTTYGEVQDNPIASQQSMVTNQVSVSINNTENFVVEIVEGSNQCDVLTKAFQDGKINSLNMKYSSSYGSYGVYQINGIGQENQIWWTYSVNGAQSPAGCSYTKVNNGDKIAWEYIGPN